MLGETGECNCHEPPACTTITSLEAESWFGEVPTFWQYLGKPLPREMAEKGIIASNAEQVAKMTQQQSLLLR